MKKLVILGGGYGGMTLLLKLIPNLPYDIMVILIDKAPYHFLKTEYHALAAGTTLDNHIRFAFPQHPQVTILNEEIVHINLSKKLVKLRNDKQIEYDNLVIGLGCEDNYHNIPGAKEFTHSIQTASNSQQTHRKLNNLLPGSNVAIIGGGLSGVELAAELAEYREEIHITIYDRGSSILSSYPLRVRNYVEKWFQAREVSIIRNSNITLIEENTVYHNENSNHYDIIIWTAGVKPNKLVEELAVDKDRNGKVILTKHHYIPGEEHVFVVGDCASLNLPSSAQVAAGQAEQIATILISRWKGAKIPEALPSLKLKGILGSLGKKHGFGLIANTALTGRVPRLLKSGVLWKDKNKKGKSL